MPPTIQRPRRPDDADKKRGERRSELVCRVKYNNTLPDIPFDPKFITYPFESNRYVQYNQTSLERSYKHDLLTEHDLGVVIDLINPDTYRQYAGAQLDQDDERLLEEEVASLGESKRSRHHNKNVSWLRKTEYISTEYNRFMPSTEKVESKIGFSIKKMMKEEEVYKDRESQIAAIESTFDEAEQEITQHHSKPGIHAIDVLPVYPDFELWKHPCAQVIFDSDPAPKGMSVPAQTEEMSQAMIRGVVDESGEQFVAYFLPTPETRTKRKRDADDTVDYYSDEEYDYMLAREYNWNVKNKASRGYEETYFFVFREDGVYYDELETRVRLSKRRKAAGAAPTPSTRLVVKHRQLNKPEVKAQEIRAGALGPPGEEEEEEEEEEQMEATEEGNESPRRSRSRSRSGSRSRSRSRSKSGSRSRSRSRSRSKSGSRSRSRSKSRSRSRSKSKSRSRSRSRSKSGSRSRSRSRSKSRSRSRSKSGSRSRSRSRSKSGSRSRSRSRSKSKSKSRSRSRSASKSPSRSRSRSRSRSKSKSRSRSRSKSKSRSRSRSGSRASSRSGSGSPASRRSASPDAKKDAEEIFGDSGSDEE